LPLSFEISDFTSFAEHIIHVAPDKCEISTTGLKKAAGEKKRFRSEYGWKLVQHERVDDVSGQEVGVNPIRCGSLKEISSSGPSSALRTRD
jgi:hypothetical protein